MAILLQLFVPIMFSKKSVDVKRIERRLTAVKTLWRDEDGVYTIEASLVFPVIVLVTLCLLFISMTIYQKVTLYYAASVTADRASYNWDNSMKDPESGGFSVPEDGQLSDGLYWRMSDDDAGDLFGFLFQKVTSLISGEHTANTGCSTTQGSSVIRVSGNDSIDSSGLPAQKLKQAVARIPPGTKGYIDYRNLLLDRTITVCLEKTLHMPMFWMSKESVYVHASAKVADPVDFIRSMNLVQSYLPLLTERFHNQNTNISNVQESISNFIGRTSNK
jgi:hypothetical protein